MSLAPPFTSTLALGAYSRTSAGDSRHGPICAALLRAAYLGTLLAAAALGRRKVVLTLIGGGALGNPVPLIWESIRWAVSEVEPLVSVDMDVVVKGRNHGDHIRPEDILPVERSHGGVVGTPGPRGASVLR
jgi:hypothetical protein